MKRLVVKVIEEIELHHIIVMLFLLTLLAPYGYGTEYIDETGQLEWRLEWILSLESTLTIMSFTCAFYIWRRARNVLVSKIAFWTSTLIAISFVLLIVYEVLLDNIDFRWLFMDFETLLMLLPILILALLYGNTRFYIIRGTSLVLLVFTSVLVSLNFLLLTMVPVQDFMPEIGILVPLSFAPTSVIISSIEIWRSNKKRL